MTTTPEITISPAAAVEPCSCPDPVPVARALRKGAAVTLCARCGRRVRVRLR